MFSAFTIQNFKAIKSLHLPLRTWNILVGPNSVGKSTVLEAFDDLVSLPSMKVEDDKPPCGRMGTFFSGPRSLRRLLTKPDGDVLTLEAAWGDGARFGFRASSGADPETEDAQFDLWLRDQNQDTALHFPREQDSAEKIFWRQVKASVGTVMRLRLQAERMAADHYSELDVPQLQADGEGLPSVLQYIQGLRDGTLEAIEASLAQVVPDIRRIRTLPTRVWRRERQRISLNGQDLWADQAYERTGARFEVEFARVGWLPADQLSEGTLLALGLLVALHFQAPHLLLLDDIDKALHPTAQRSLVAVLQMLQKSRSNLQIVATTHSPFALNLFEADEVQMMASKDGNIFVKRLSEHPLWERRKGFMYPGEFWSGVGEQWVTGDGL